MTEKNPDQQVNGSVPTNTNQGFPSELGPLTPQARQNKAFNHRKGAAFYQKDLPLPNHLCNEDENLYQKKIGNYSKGLPHNALGEVEITAYNALIQAITTGNPAFFERIPLGGVVKLVNPQSAFAFDLVGPDSHHLKINPAPSFQSAWAAGEMVEIYWQSLTNDVPFIEYDNNCLTLAATADISKLTDFRGPKVNGDVTTRTLFRGNAPGVLDGPYISQFLYQEIAFGALPITQKIRTVLPGQEYLTSYEEWLNVQNGGVSGKLSQFDPELRYIRSGRDLCEWVHKDFSYQAPLSAALILLSYGPGALSPENPYLSSKTQSGFVTFGGPCILDFIAQGSDKALKAAWFQKWCVHRRLRPEEFGGRIHNKLVGSADYPIHHDVLKSNALSQIFGKYGTYLLPVSFPEGCPTHTSYPSGHATFLGAGVTLAKALFYEDFVIPNPVQASADGLSLVPYVGSSLTVGGELNKLAFNIAIGRNAAGVHWRTDATEGINLGEQVAIGILQDYKRTFNERFEGFTLTKFDGTTITI